MPAAKTGPAIRGVHHTAFRCRDAEETRRFYEEILGLKLAAALAFDEEPGTGAPLKYMHLFFEMGDGNYVAFFDLPDSADEAKFKKKSGFNLHIAFEVATQEELEAFQARFAANGIENHGPIDHHFVQSIYAWDPNGIQIEITCRAAAHDKIMAEERAKAGGTLATWNADTAPIKAGKLKLRQAMPAR
jgi:catechol 2,3-dioxygenase-like lactoylglutathione lyase family enzyme